MRSAIAGLALTLAAVTPDVSLAADMPIKGKPRPYDAYSSGVNWTGFYLGVNGGYGYGDSRWDYGIGPAGRFGPFPVQGWMVGLTAGYNIMLSGFVVGVEGDYDWTEISGARACFGLNCRTYNSWLATARGRIGLVMGRALPYFTGGAAFGNVKTQVDTIGSSTTTQTGWTIGGGLEVALNGGWSMKAEYLYVDLGEVNCGTACGGPPSPNADFVINVVRGGLNYKF